MKEQEFTNDRIEQWLLENRDIEYKKFMEKLLPETRGIIGVRLPALRKLAEQIAEKNWRWVLEYGQEIYLEQIMLKGMILGSIEIEWEEWKSYIIDFVPKIQNWSVCDSFCSSLKMTKKYKPMVWKLIRKYTKKEKEFSVRFGVVMLLDYYIEEDYIEEVFGVLEDIKNKTYYAKMAVAWAISACYIKFPERTERFIKKSKLDKWTLKKGLQKIIESKSIGEEERNKIREIKKKF